MIIVLKPRTSDENVKRVENMVRAKGLEVHTAFHPDDTIVDVSGVKVGGGHLALIAGPCSVESEEQVIEIAKAVKASGANMLRGGAFKPRTSPY